jgi:hypothetical protein
MEIVLAVFGIASLSTAQAMLSSAIVGTNYYGVDGKMAQTTIIAAFKFGYPFSVNNISPIAGIGSQMLPMNAWGNPAYWPFAFLDKEVATDVSAIVAMGILALACYIMARCFDVPVVPSILAAQSTVLLFAPTLLLLHMPTVYCLTPGNAVVYAPHLVALGLLARVEPRSSRKVVFISATIAALLFYSVYCDPLWTTISGISWALPFAVVTLSAVHLSAVLASCVVLLAVSGALEYLYTLSQYTARVQFSLVVDRPRGPDFVSALTYSPNMKTFYLACIIGWLLDLWHCGAGRAFGT